MSRMASMIGFAASTTRGAEDMTSAQRPSTSGVCLVRSIRRSITWCPDGPSRRSRPASETMPTTCLPASMTTARCRRVLSMASSMSGSDVSGETVGTSVTATSPARINDLVRGKVAGLMVAVAWAWVPDVGAAGVPDDGPRGVDANVTVLIDLVTRSYGSGVPRAFSADESDHIRSRLKAAGGDAFARRGLRGTTIDELARAAGISKGAFYRFYDSKEALLLALLDEYETAAHAEIEAAVRVDPQGGIEYLIDSAIHALESHPLLMVLMSEEGLRVLWTATPEQQMLLLESDLRLVQRVVSVMRDAGVD